MRGREALKVKVCAILTFILLAILVTFLVVLPILIISDLISFIASGESFVFTMLPIGDLLWFLPSQHQMLPLNLGQFLDVCILCLISLQIASASYVILSRFYKYQQLNVGILPDRRQKYDETLPNFMRWNILPHGNQFNRNIYDAKNIGQNFFDCVGEDLHWTFSKEQRGFLCEINDDNNIQRFYRSLSERRSLISFLAISSELHRVPLCHIHAFPFDQFVSARHRCNVSNLGRILTISPFSNLVNSDRQNEVLADYVVS